MTVANFSAWMLPVMRMVRCDVADGDTGGTDDR